MVLPEPPPFKFDFKRSMAEILGIKVAPSRRSLDRPRTTMKPEETAEAESYLPEPPAFRFDFKRPITEILGIKIEPEMEDSESRILSTDLDNSYKSLVDRSVSQLELEITLAAPKASEEAPKEQADEAEAEPILSQAVPYVDAMPDETITYEQFGSQPFVASTLHAVKSKRRSSILERRSATPDYEPMEVDATLSPIASRSPDRREETPKRDATVYMEVDETTVQPDIAAPSESVPPVHETLLLQLTTEKVKESAMDEPEITAQLESVDPASETVRNLTVDEVKASATEEPETAALPESMPTVDQAVQNLTAEEVKVKESVVDEPGTAALALPESVEPAYEIERNLTTGEEKVLEATVVDTDVTVLSDSALISDQSPPSPVSPSPPLGCVAAEEETDVQAPPTPALFDPPHEERLIQEDLSASEEPTGRLPKPVPYPFGPLKTLKSFKTPERDDPDMAEERIDRIDFSVASEGDTSGVFGDVSALNQTLAKPRKSKSRAPKHDHPCTLDLDPESTLERSDIGRRHKKSSVSVRLDLSELLSHREKSFLEKTARLTSALSISMNQPNLLETKERLKNGWRKNKQNKKAKELREKSEVPVPEENDKKRRSISVTPSDDVQAEKVLAKPPVPKRSVEKRRSMSVNLALVAASMFTTGSPAPSTAALKSKRKKLSVRDADKPSRSGDFKLDVQAQEDDLFVKPPLPKPGRKSMAVSHVLEAPNIFTTGTPAPSSATRKKSRNLSLPEAEAFKKPFMYDTRTPHSRRSGVIVNDVQVDDLPPASNVPTAATAASPSASPAAKKPRPRSRAKTLSARDVSDSLNPPADETVNSTTGRRRSIRNRVPVMQKYLGERVKYQYDDMGLPTFKGITKTK